MKMVRDQLKSSIKQGVIPKAFVFIILQLVLVNIAFANVETKVEQIADATHIEFSGKNQWNYQLKRISPRKFKLNLAALSERAEAELRTWEGPHIKDISINKNGENGAYEVIFTVASDAVESFDYQTDQPSRLIVDFYKEEKEQRKPLPSTKKIAKKKVRPKKNSVKKAIVAVGDGIKRSTGKLDKRSPFRKPAGSEVLSVERLRDIENRVNKVSGYPQRGVFDGGDPNYDRLRIKTSEIDENSIISSRQEIYVKFPMLRLQTGLLDQLIETPPSFVIKEKDSRENKEARFLLYLFQNKKNASFLKSYTYFKKKFPKSEYDEIISNMAAEVYHRLWWKDKNEAEYVKAVNLYEALINKYPDSVLTKRTRLFLISSEYYRGSALSSLQKSLDYIAAYPKSPENDDLRKIISDSYLTISRNEDARKALVDLNVNAVTRDASVEAIYRYGDVDFRANNYKKAIKEYGEALDKYPNYAGTFPNAYYNTAESQFWLGEYQESLDNYIKFLQNFPSHPHAAYALTRAAELLEILGADRSQVMGAFLESFYRFRETDGGGIARIRLLSQKMKTMSKKEFASALKEIRNIAKKSKLPRMLEFATLKEVDGLRKRKSFDEALAKLISYYQRFPTSTDLSFFKKRILGNISDSMKEKIEDSQYLEVLEQNKKYSTTWLNNLDRLDIPFFVGKAYELAGVYNEAENTYRNVLRRREGLVGKKTEKERMVNEHLPSPESLRLRLASSQYEQREYGQAEQQINQIKDLRKISPTEKVERVELIAKLAEEKGNFKKAKTSLEQLINNWQGKPELLSGAYYRLAKVQYSLKEYVKAEDSLLELERIRNSSENLSKSLVADYLKLKGDTLLKLGKQVSAVENYMELLNQYEKEMPLASVRYKAGEILFDRGDIKGAEKLWGVLEENDSQMYSRLAKEKLESAKWQDEYKKYINRIPAASKILKE